MFWFISRYKTISGQNCHGGKGCQRLPRRPLLPKAAKPAIPAKAAKTAKAATYSAVLKRKNPKSQISTIGDDQILMTWIFFSLFVTKTKKYKPFLFLFFLFIELLRTGLHFKRSKEMEVRQPRLAAETTSKNKSRLNQMRTKKSFERFQKGASLANPCSHKLPFRNGWV